MECEIHKVNPMDEVLVRVQGANNTEEANENIQ
jgi:hypothetical protein